MKKTSLVIIKTLTIKKDNRGWLSELIRRDDVGESFGQLLITTALPGQKKGGHYHRRKIEWYIVIKGEGMLYLKDIKSKREERLLLTENKIQLIQIPPNIFHTIENMSKEELYLLTYTNEQFNPEDPDTYIDENA